MVSALLTSWISWREPSFAVIISEHRGSQRMILELKV